ncbi:MAG TPA: arginine deiminase-related protein [Candidatus Angelobacter sp.]|jgi:N-dimethylarginine dimethylaminohydrolase|nr:arginine deiminase-related protein [Candidatus Angelobacter sp.]
MAILMCRPDFFGVEYEINPWMHVADQVDRSRAATQWDALHRTYTELGQDVVLAAPVKGLPDMVFTANAGVVRGGRAVLSRFRHPERQGEEPYWERAFEEQGFEVVKPPREMSFEGAGDALFVGDTLFAGYGFRTGKESHRFVGRALGVDVVSLELVDPRFYHLDTCFCPLNERTVIFAPEAFSPYSARTIRKLVPHVIEVPTEVAAGFACNAIAVGNRVISSTAAARLGTRLHAEGFDTMALPMTEFMKSGGGVRCLSLPL